jgi:hypothetical protein
MRTVRRTANQQRRRKKHSKDRAAPRWAGASNCRTQVAVAGFSLLIFAVGLNLSGVFEVGSIALGDSLANRTGTLGAFRIGFGWKRAACNNQEQ